MLTIDEIFFFKEVIIYTKGIWLNNSIAVGNTRGLGGKIAVL